MKSDAQQPIHCMELMTGRNLTGFFSLRDDHIGATLYSYDDPFHVETEAPIHLCAANNEIISLHSNVAKSSGEHSRLSTPARTTYQQEIISNIAVTGHDAWTDKDRVKRATFEIKHSDRLLRHKKKFDSLVSSRHPEKDAWQTLKERSGGFTIEVNHSTSYKGGSKTPDRVWTRFTIDFDAPATIHDFTNPVCDLYHFISFGFGAHLPPSEFHIDRMSYDEMEAAMEEQAYPGDHEVHYVWPQADIDSSELWLGGSPVIAWDDEELAAFCACLVVWMERSANWRKSYALMEACLKKKNEISPARLINACRWLEEIPLTIEEQTISDADIKTISTAASQAAKDLGIEEEICHRIQGSVRWLKKETREERFLRLVKKVQHKFGPKCLPETAVQDLKRAFGFRGKTAHGHYVPKDESEFRAFTRSIAALESLCLLLTAYDLPINDAGIERMKHTPLIRDYLLHN